MKKGWVLPGSIVLKAMNFTSLPTRANSSTKAIRPVKGSSLRASKKTVFVTDPIARQTL